MSLPRSTGRLRSIATWSEFQPHKSRLGRDEEMKKDSCEAFAAAPALHLMLTNVQESRWKWQRTIQRTTARGGRSWDQGRTKNTRPAKAPRPPQAICHWRRRLGNALRGRCESFPPAVRSQPSSPGSRFDAWFFEDAGTQE